MIFDIDQERVDELTHAFRAGEQRGYNKGREERDDAYLAECVELRTNRNAADEKAFKQGYETAALHACLLVGVLAFWWYVGANIVLPLVGWLA